MKHTSLQSRRKALAALAIVAIAPHSMAESISLPFEPIPKNAHLLAQKAATAIQNIDGVVLDYSHDSLKHIDEIVLRFRSKGTSPQAIGSTLFVFGCYVGEVIAQQLGAKWDMPNEEERRLGFDWMGVRTANGAFWDPIAKVFKLLRNGDEDSVWYLFSVIQSEQK
jgi:hypothetical protein